MKGINICIPRCRF